MKLLSIILLFHLLFIFGCMNSNKSKLPDVKGNSVTFLDTSDLNIRLIEFDVKYKKLETELYDSAAKYRSDIDFSALTPGLERVYNETNNKFEKTMIGLKLAKNYYIHYNGNPVIEYKNKAEPLFLSFTKLDSGIVASRILKIDIKMVKFINNNWGNFSEAEKDSIMFYGLLRGFEHGYPKILEKTHNQ